MYLDCRVCGWESACFVILGNTVQAAKTVSDSWELLPNGETIYRCPNGHVANFAPSMLKFYKRQLNKTVDELTPEAWFENKLESSGGPPKLEKKYETSSRIKPR